MLFLRNFQLMNEDRYAAGIAQLCNTLTPDEYYPIGFFPQKQLTQLDFENITILYGGNGFGKTTLLNIMAEKLSVFRQKEYLQTKMFSFYYPEPLRLRPLCSTQIF